MKPMNPNANEEDFITMSKAVVDERFYDRGNWFRRIIY